MRKVIVYSMISLDGVMQAPGGPKEDESGGFAFGGWTEPFGDEVFEKVIEEELKQTDYLLGRKTFDIWEAYWPNHAEYWPGINEGQKYVLSTTRKESGWKHSNFINSIDEIRKIKNEAGPNLQVWGSSELIHSLLKYDLVDELRIKTYPLLLGKGKKLFRDDSTPGTYILVSQQVTTTGVILAHYKRAGAVKTGDLTI